MIGRWWRKPCAVAALGLVLASCSSSTKTTGSTTRGSGPVDVLYAASLVNLMEKQIGPAFDSATGYSFNGFSGNSGGLASQIKGKLRQGDVFISAGASVDAELEGESNGNWVTWYGAFATSKLVLGYSPHSRFAPALTSKPWYEVITEPGFLIGRTDPATDPKGKLTSEALKAAATTYGQPKLDGLANSNGNVYPEDTLVGRLQAGQLDAGFFYASEAKAAGIPTVPLTGENYEATYTVTVLNNAPDSTAADAFVSYLLGEQGAQVLTSDGFELISPAKVTGSGVPPSLQGVLSS